ncbi:MAG: hypothetical protein AAB573_01595 [Patescibacteria group bacterium]
MSEYHKVNIHRSLLRLVKGEDHDTSAGRVVVRWGHNLPNATETVQEIETGLYPKRLGPNERTPKNEKIAIIHRTGPQQHRVGYFRVTRSQKDPLIVIADHGATTKKPGPMNARIFVLGYDEKKLEPEFFAESIKKEISFGPFHWIRGLWRPIHGTPTIKSAGSGFQIGTPPE